MNVHQRNVQMEADARKMLTWQTCSGLEANNHQRIIERLWVCWSMAMFALKTFQATRCCTRKLFNRISPAIIVILNWLVGIIRARVSILVFEPQVHMSLTPTGAPNSSRPRVVSWKKTVGQKPVSLRAWSFW